MNVTVKLFAGLRERAGWSERAVDAASVADVWPSLDLGEEPAGLLYAVNHEYAELDRQLADGDEVARSSRPSQAARSGWSMARSTSQRPWSRGRGRAGRCDRHLPWHGSRASHVAGR